jgi:hypothetical protein
MEWNLNLQPPLEAAEQMLLDVNCNSYYVECIVPQSPSSSWKQTANKILNPSKWETTGGGDGRESPREQTDTLVPQSSCYTVSFLPLQLPFVSKSIISI